jgi:hypothetical protein
MQPLQKGWISPLLGAKNALQASINLFKQQHPQIGQYGLLADLRTFTGGTRPNGSKADKAPFLNLSTVQPATRLSSSLCAINHR